MVILLTEKTGYTALINTEFMVCATTTIVGPRELPEHTVVTLVDGNSITVLEAPEDILDIMAGEDQGLEYELEEPEEAPDQPVTIERTIHLIPPKPPSADPPS